MITYLTVPYDQKDKVKAMGARYNMSTKQWYVPDGIDLVPFLPWVRGVQVRKKIKRVLGKSV